MLVAGIDIGNSTTEIVIARDGVPVVWDRAVTRGTKGSLSSVAGALSLLNRLELRVGRVDTVVVAPLRAVSTTTLTIPAPSRASGPLHVIAAGTPTPGGDGVGIGRPLLLDTIHQHLPKRPLAHLSATSPGDVTGSSTDVDHGPGIVALVPLDVGYERAAAAIRLLLAEGAPIRAVLVEGDEGRLIANRLGRPLPVMDQIDLATVRDAEAVAVEVCAPGTPLRRLSDALFLSSVLGTAPGQAAEVCRDLHDVSNAVVSLDAARRVSAELPYGQNAAPQQDHEAAAGPPRADLHRAVVDLGALAAAVHARTGATASRSYLLATLGPASDAAAVPAAGRPLRLAPGEAAAARRGALTTPGATPEALVIDIGGGTVDLISRMGEVVAAGAGDLLTAAVAAVLGIPKGAAEWVKRGPCVRVESPQLIVGEDGSRTFLDFPAPSATVGRLAVPGPAGLLPFTSAMSPAEWRALRLSIKQEVLGGTVSRALHALAETTPRGVVLAGGPAGDSEILAVLARTLPSGTAIGRANVAGVLGHRYAVAYGLASMPDST